MKKRYLQYPLPSAFILMFALSSCSSTKKVEPQTVSVDSQKSISNNNIGVENSASWYTELNFKKSSAHLDNSDYVALDDLVMKSKRSGKIDEIKIISWADVEYPQSKGRHASNGQKNLAEQRNKNIKKYLKKNYPSINVEVYNMATRPNALQELFNTSDARTKKSIETAGVELGGEYHANFAKKESTSLVLSVLK